MPKRIVNTLEAVQVCKDNADGVVAVFLQPEQGFIKIEPVIQTGHHIVSAQVAQVIFGLLAGSNILNSDQHPGKIILMTGHHPEIQMDVNGFAGQRIVDALTLIRQATVVEIGQFTGKMRAHFISKDPVQVGEQVFFRLSAKQFQSPLVDIQHPDQAHAVGHGFGVKVKILQQIIHPRLAHLIQKSLDAAVILLPEGDG